MAQGPNGQLGALAAERRYVRPADEPFLLTDPRRSSGSRSLQRRPGARLIPHHRASFLGLGTGIAYGMVAPLIKDVIALAGTDPLQLVTTWPAYALVITGASAIVLNQTAYQATPSPR